MDDKDLLEAALVYSNRTLGFVNAPALFQKVAAMHLERAVGLDAYRERRDMLYDIVTGAGFECMKPGGAFYLFPKSPIPDDKKFAEIALKHRTIVVAGSGFSYPGYFRLAYCVSRETIKGSEKAFREIMDEIKEIKREH